MYVRTYVCTSIFLSFNSDVSADVSSHEIFWRDVRYRTVLLTGDYARYQKIERRCKGISTYVFKLKIIGY